MSRYKHMRTLSSQRADFSFLLFFLKQEHKIKSLICHINSEVQWNRFSWINSLKKWFDLLHLTFFCQKHLILLDGSMNYTYHRSLILVMRNRCIYVSGKERGERKRRDLMAYRDVCSDYDIFLCYKFQV